MPVVPFHTLWADQGSIPLYNGADCCVTAEIDELDRDLKSPYAQLLYNLERALQGPVLEMQLRGFRVDPVERESATKIAREKLRAVSDFLSQVVPAVTTAEYNPTFPNSTPQLINFFYNHLKLVPIRKFSHGESKLSMDRDVLEQLENHFYARPMALAILLYRDLLGTLEVLEKEIDPDWRWRCTYNIAGTTTFRFSSSGSGLGTGSNFQNITEALRRVFIADTGKKICGIDLEQADAREVGYFCGVMFNDWSYLDACESGDLHTFVTRLAYPDWAWTGDLKKDRKIAERRFYRHYSYRDANKRLGHGTNFYGKPKQLSTQTKIPYKHVCEFQERYFDIFPCIVRMHEWHAQQLQRHGYIVNMYGARRDFLDRKDSNETLRAAIAYTFQSATGIRNNLALWKLWRHMGDRIQILAQLHDANYFQFDIKDNEQEIVTEALRLTETWVTAPCGRRFNVPGEAKVGFNWASKYKPDADGNMVEWNPQGLTKFKG